MNDKIFEIDHTGHRERLRNKIDYSSLAQHELLEILLFCVHKRRNTNDIAHRLISAFGNVYNVLNAPRSQLTEIPEVGNETACFINTLAELNRRFKEGVPSDQPEIFLPDTFTKYLQEQYAGRVTEVFDIFFIDGNQKIKYHERFKNYNENVVVIPIETINRLLIEHQPYALVCAHNHPVGKCEPSASDDKATKQLQLICSSQNVLFCDHFICSPSGMYSYHACGKMQEISKKYSLNNIVSD